MGFWGIEHILHLGLFPGKRIVGINFVEHSALNIFPKKIGSPEFLWMTGGRRSKGLFTFDSGKISPPRSEVSLEKGCVHTSSVGVTYGCVHTSSVVHIYSLRSSVLALPSSRQAVVDQIPYEGIKSLKSYSPCGSVKQRAVSIGKPAQRCAKKIGSPEFLWMTGGLHSKIRTMGASIQLHLPVWSVSAPCGCRKRAGGENGQPQTSGRKPEPQWGITPVNRKC